MLLDLWPLFRAAGGGTVSPPRPRPRQVPKRPQVVRAGTAARVVVAAAVAQVNADVRTAVAVTVAADVAPAAATAPGPAVTPTSVHAAHTTARGHTERSRAAVAAANRDDEDLLLALAILGDA